MLIENNCDDLEQTISDMTGEQVFFWDEESFGNGLMIGEGSGISGLDEECIGWEPTMFCYNPTATMQEMFMRSSSIYPA